MDGSREGKLILVLENVPLFVPHGEKMLDLVCAAKKHDAAAEERMTGEAETCHVAVLGLTTVAVSDASCDEILNRGVEVHGEAEIAEAKLTPDVAERRDGNGVRIEEERRLPTELVDLRLVVATGEAVCRRRDLDEFAVVKAKGWEIDVTDDANRTGVAEAAKVPDAAFGEFSIDLAQAEIHYAE